MKIKLRNNGSEIFIPDNLDIIDGISKTTHVGIAAHPDDLEIMAFDGILKCFRSRENWFLGIVVTDGAGSPRDGIYKAYSGEEMKKVRNREQKKAAIVGEYGGLAFLNYTSSALKDPKNANPKEDLKALLALARPHAVYIHNLADKHDTHVAAGLNAIQAMRELPLEHRPAHVYGCEVWRDLDWLVDEDKVGFDVSSHQNLATTLVGVFDSQVCGGKRYDLATLGRRRAHATYHATHDVDISQAMIFAMDLTPLVKDPGRDIWEYISGHITRFAEDVRKRMMILLDRP